MKRRTKSWLALALMGYAIAAGAHTMWINLVPAREDRQVLVSIGYGDFLPGSELLSTDWGQMRVARYEAISPDGKRSPLAPPTPVEHDKQTLPSGVVVQQGGDAGIHRLQYPAGSATGTYQVAAQSDLFTYTQYRDKRGQEHFTDKPLDELVDVDQVLSTSSDLFFMKTAFVVGAWTEPEPVGHYLEILPLTDLSALRAGDAVRFKVLLNGKGWNPASGAPQISANSTSFGDGWGLAAPVKYGEAELRLPSAGMWRIEARVQGKGHEFQGLTGTDPQKPIYIESTFVLHVRP